MKTGIIEFILSNVGSKSEKMQPFLKEEDGNLVEVFKESDNPFKNESLKPYEGKKVTITGEENEYGLFIIDTINVVDEKAVPAEAALVETTPVETAPVETVTVETAPVETVTVETVTVETAPAEAVVAEEAVQLQVAPKSAVEIVEEKTEETEEKAEEASEAPAPTPAEAPAEPPLKGFKKFFALFHRK